MTVNMEIGMITPPVGMNLFVVHGIRPDKGGIQDAISRPDELAREHVARDVCVSALSSFAEHVHVQVSGGRQFQE